LTLSLPRRVTACTGLDALVHAVECAVTLGRTPISLVFAHEAFRLLEPNLPRVLSDPADLEARAAMLLGAAFAGIAIEQSMLGAAHALANPLTMRYGTAHGQAVGTVLPWVIRFNAADPAAGEAYAHLAETAGLKAQEGSEPSPGERLARRIEELLDQAGFPRSLSLLGVPASDIPDLATEAAGQWTGQFNPRGLETGDLVRLYRQALGEPG
jgi:alcohol dehydrogenase